YLLGDVLGVAARATPFVGGAEDQLVVLLDQPAERHAVTGLGARDHAARRTGGSRAFPVIKLGHQCQELPAPAAAAFPIWNSDACRWPFLGGNAKYSRPAMARAGEEDYLCAVSTRRRRREPMPCPTPKSRD